MPPISNQDQSLFNEAPPLHTPDASQSYASLLSAPRTTAAIAPQADESSRARATRRGYPIAKRYGCVLNSTDFTVKFVGVELPGELAVRFLLRTEFGGPHVYAVPNGFMMETLTGLASQMTDYWPPITD